MAAARLDGIGRDALVTFRRGHSESSLDTCATNCEHCDHQCRRVRSRAGAPGLEFSDVAVTGVAEVDTWLRHRLTGAGRRAGRPAGARRAAVEAAFTNGFDAAGPLMERIDARLDPSAFAEALAEAARSAPSRSSG